MQEGSPPDPASASEAPAVTEPTEPTEAEVSEVTATEPRTPEEIEAIWKNRVAGKDRAHAAETATLRQQLEQERRQREALENQRSAEQAGQLSEAEQWKQKAEAAEARAAEIEKQRILDVRTAKYGAAAEALDETVLVAMDEAKLAALNARLSGEEAPPAPVIDPNQPRRPTASAPSREKGIEELEADLKKYEPEFRATLEG